MNSIMNIIEHAQVHNIFMIMSSSIKIYLEFTSTWNAVSMCNICSTNHNSQVLNSISSSEEMNKFSK